MAWGLSSWLGLVRWIQVLATLTASAVNAYLVAYISINRLGLSQNMQILQGMITAQLLFVASSLAIVHTGKRSKDTQWLVATIVGDTIFIGISLAAITILAQAGVPQHCAGLTRWNYTPEDENRPPRENYTSIRFTNGWGGAKGELDKYCAQERGFFVILLALVFMHIITIVLSVLRICQSSYTKNSKVHHLLSAIRVDDKLKSPSTSPSPGSEPQSPHPVLGHPYHQHHVTTTHPVSSPTIASSLSARASVQQLPTHAIGVSSSISSSQNLHHMSPRQQPVRTQQQHHQQQHPGHLYSPGPSSSSSSSRQPPQPAIQTYSYETPEESAAAAALITDGSNPGPPGLPPYTPGRLAPMMGHGNESNDIRLSEYVKGETRAQNMKDSGGF